MSGVKLHKEIDWVMNHKDLNVSRLTAEAIVDSRLCAVSIQFDCDEGRWVLEIERSGEILYTKRSAFSNRMGIVTGLWSFVGEAEEIPWTRILNGLVWRNEKVIMDYRLWRRLEHAAVENERLLLFLPTNEALVH